MPVKPPPTTTTCSACAGLSAAPVEARGPRLPALATGERARPRDGLHERRTILDELPGDRDRAEHPPIDARRELARRRARLLQGAFDPRPPGLVILEAPRPTTSALVATRGVSVHHFAREDERLGVGDLARASSIPRSHPCAAGIEVHRRHPKPGRGQRHRVAADAAADVEDLHVGPERLPHAPRLPGGHALARCLLDTRHIAPERVCVGELRDGLPAGLRELQRGGNEIRIEPSPQAGDGGSVTWVHLSGSGHRRRLRRQALPDGDVAPIRHGQKG